MRSKCRMIKRCLNSRDASFHSNRLLCVGGGGLFENDMPNHELPGSVDGEARDHKKTDKPNMKSSVRCFRAGYSTGV